MLAALIATRPFAPQLSFYTNQLVAATTTFTCMFIAQQAAFISTNAAACQALNASTVYANVSQTETFAWLHVAGQEAVSSILRSKYNAIRSARGGNDPVFLSNTIIQVILTVSGTLMPLLAALPVAPQNAARKTALQQKAALALAVLYSLATPPDKLSFVA